MGFLNKLFGKKQVSSVFTDEELLGAGVCPNCWGKQEYDNQYVEFVNDQTKSNVNHDKLHQKAFIQQFVESNITGIRLKNIGNEQVCPVCKAKA